MPIRTLAHRLRALWFRRRFERDLDAELEFHRAMAAEAASPRRFGNELRLREQAREAWMFVWLESLLQDLRLAARSIRHAPGFAAAVVLTLALGIGANSAIFSLAWAVLWQPLPYPHASRLVEIRQARNGQHWMMTSPFDIAAARQADTGLLDWSRYRGDSMTLTGAGDPSVLMGAEVEAGALQLLGVKPVLGRLLLPSDDHPGAAPVVLLSARVWRERWNSNPSILGHPVRLDGKAYTVAGVLPGSFEFPGHTTAYWRAWQQAPEGPGSRDIGAIARLAPGVSLAQATTRANQQMRRLAAAHPQDKGWRFVLIPMRTYVAGDSQTQVWLMLAVVGLVLLIAAANVACLVSARAQRRQHELATRAALGAGRARMLRQLWTETALLTALGAGVGLALAAGAIVWLRSAAPAYTPRLSHVALSWPVLAFTAAVAVLVLVTFGLAPAWSATGRTLEHHLRPAPTMAGGRGRGAWVVAQVALSLPLLAGAALLLTAFARMSAVPLGFQPRHALTFDISLPAARYPTSAGRWRFLQAAEQGFSALPGVESATMASFLPLNGNADSVYSLPNKLAKPNEFTQRIGYNAIAAGYFVTLQIPLRAGRRFEASDSASSPPVTIINQAAAGQLFPGVSPIGQRIRYDWGKQGWRTIVGVVGNVQPYVPDSPEPPPAIAYVPLAQSAAMPSDVAFVLRTPDAPLALLSAVRHTLASLDAVLPAQNPEAFTGLYADSLAQPRFRAWLVGGFAALALLLTALGMFGVLAYSVAARRPELGVRSALGARPAQLLELILRQALRLLLLGLALGLGLSLVLTRFLHALLFGLSPTDPWVLTAVSLLLLGAGIAAAWIPARRAMGIDPASVLRCE